MSVRTLEIRKDFIRAQP
uniref:Uncharacterized protein n=1 Tax=Anguilla anguilla TaxID=7936 RepID=A0A0E9W1D8_ANGAN